MEREREGGWEALDVRKGWGRGGWRGGSRAVVRRREGVLHLGWGAGEIERDRDSGGASNILFRCVASPCFLPHLHISPFFLHRPIFHLPFPFF